MKRGIMALEDNEERIEPSAPGEIDTAIAENKKQSAELENDADQIAETQSIDGALGEMQTTAEAAVESGEGLSEETASTMEAALEHFTKRLGYSKKVIPALEGFSDKATCLEKTKITLENLKTLRSGIDKNLAIAQEGMLSNIFDSISKTFSTFSGIEKSLREAHAEFKQNGPNGKTFKSPGWGRAIAKFMTLQDSDRPEDVTKELIEFAVWSDKHLIRWVNDSIAIMDQINSIIPDQMFVKSTDAMADVLNHLVEKVKEDGSYLFNRNLKMSSISKNITEFEALTEKSEKQIFEASIHLVADPKYREAFGKLAYLNRKMAAKATGGARGESHAKTYRAISQAKQIVMELTLAARGVYELHCDVAHSLSKYIQASTK